jgi:hypothetical protein
MVPLRLCSPQLAWLAELCARQPARGPVAIRHIATFPTQGRGAPQCSTAEPVSIVSLYEHKPTLATPPRVRDAVTAHRIWRSTCNNLCAYLLYDVAQHNAALGCPGHPG